MLNQHDGQDRKLIQRGMGSRSRPDTIAKVEAGCNETAKRKLGVARNHTSGWAPGGRRHLIEGHAHHR